MKLLTLLDREVQEAIRNRLLVFTVLLPCLIFAVMPIGMLYAAGADPMKPDELEILYRMDSSMRSLDPLSATQVLLVNQIMLLFLMIPAVVPLIIASFSIIGEKQARTLEPLLAAPIRVLDLLLAKCLAAVVPAVVATWVSYAISLAGIWVLGTELTRQAALNSIWMVSMFTLAPALGITAVELAVIVSSRVNDTRVAQQISVVLVLPVMALFVGQMAGAILVSVQVILLATLLLLVVDAALLRVAVKLFRRESILTEWR